jgi:hypothetical protein
MKRRAFLLVLAQWLIVVVPSPGLTQTPSTKKAEHTPVFPTYTELADGPGRNLLLPGQDAFVFTLYGCPAQLKTLKELVQVMQESGLGNGFDPGPIGGAQSKPLFEYLATVGWPIISYPPYYGEFQIKEGRARLSDHDEAALQILDRAGVFSALQLGEWGYFFHNLSSSENWFRSAYGKDFPDFKHLLKPRGLAGYDSRPKTRQECYDIVKDYYLTRNRYMRGRNLSVTGHSHYEAYAGEWGTRAIGLELGENIAFTQSKLAFARGAARQWNRPWSVQISPWFHGSCTTNGALRKAGKYARGLDAGHSLSFYRRLWLHAWFAGAAMVTPENSLAIFFEEAASPWDLTTHGRAAAEVFAFMRKHERGIPYTPVAIVLDHLAGYNAYKGRPWGIMDNTPGDLETKDLFQQQLFPGSDHIHARPFPDNPEQSYLRPSPFGEMFDVLLSSAKTEVLEAYPVILLVGDISFDRDFTGRLVRAASKGCRLLLTQRHAQALTSDFEQLQQAGRVEVLKDWLNPATKRNCAVSNKRLADLNSQYLPIGVMGDPIQYQVNRNQRAWVIELINNRGIIKKPDQAALVEPQGSAQVELWPRIPIQSAAKWSHPHDIALNTGVPMPIIVGPGETVFVELLPAR